MKADLVEYKSYFPLLGDGADAHMLVDTIMKSMQADGNIEYAGFVADGDLHRSLVDRVFGRVLARQSLQERSFRHVVV